MADTKQAKPGWKSIPIGGLIKNPGSAAEFHTGDWRTERPIWDAEKCINCMRCVVYCPDVAFIVEDGKVTGIDYAHCKGCAICVSVCPPKVQALHMEPESKHRED
ncbi:MAG TPA: 4Fe-4S binding protein [Firmicutes bacterium]|nr:4Fe-4S binding protein [Bacillota bacterium]